METQQQIAELPLRPQDELECRRCEVHCDKVVYPAACVSKACPFLYAIEEFGHKYIGSMQKVYDVEIDIDLLAAGTGPNRRWLVDYFQPRETLVTAGDRPASGPQPKDPGLGPHLAQRWLLVPLGIFLLILLVPLGLGLRHWSQGRAAERAFGDSRELPPLPRRPGPES